VAAQAVAVRAAARAEGKKSLFFCESRAGSEDVAIAYVIVYPLTMLLRVFAAQWMILFLLG
jgi:uncharacterized transporter YbjL